MPTDYQRKYMEAIKIYHQLHTELAGLTMKLADRMDKLGISALAKDNLSNAINDFADKIKKIDLKFRDLIRVIRKSSKDGTDLSVEDVLNMQ